jgi:hypothetical protein
VSTFQHHTKLCFKCSTLLVSCLNLSPICWGKEPSSCWMPFAVSIYLISPVHLASYVIMLPK